MKGSLLARVKPFAAWARDRNPSKLEIVMYMRVVLELQRQTDIEYARRLVEVY